MFKCRQVDLCMLVFTQQEVNSPVQVAFIDFNIQEIRGFPYPVTPENSSSPASLPSNQNFLKHFPSSPNQHPTVLTCLPGQHCGTASGVYRPFTYLWSNVESSARLCWNHSQAQKKEHRRVFCGPVVVILRKGKPSRAALFPISQPYLRNKSIFTGIQICPALNGKS